MDRRNRERDPNPSAAWPESFYPRSLLEKGEGEPPLLLAEEVVILSHPVV